MKVINADKLIQFIKENASMQDMPKQDEDIVHCNECAYSYIDEDSGRCWCERTTGSFQVAPDDLCRKGARKEKEANPDPKEDSAQPKLIMCKDCMHNGSFDTDCPIDWPGKKFCNFGETEDEETETSPEPPVNYNIELLDINCSNFSLTLDWKSSIGTGRTTFVFGYDLDIEIDDETERICAGDNREFLRQLMQALIAKCIFILYSWKGVRKNE